MGSDTIKSWGNPLTSKALQPGWTVEYDGFGLETSTCKFKLDGDVAYSTFANSDFLFGSSHPKYSNLHLYRANCSFDKGDVATITADYCGLTTSIGSHSTPRVAMVGSSAAEDITHHPNFSKINCTSISGGSVLAGYPPDTIGFVDNTTTNPNRAAWTPKSTNSGITQGAQFIGFLPAQKSTDATNVKAGVKSYYKPSSTLRVLTYYASQSDALSVASYVGWATGGSVLDLPTAWKNLATTAYPGTFQYTSEWLDKIHRSFLITNASVELYGAIYKLTADLMLSGISGWDKDIYPYVD